MTIARRAPRWATSARMLGAAMTGLDEAMFGPKEKRPGVIVDASGDPPGDQPFELLLDPEHPELSMVIVHQRPPGTD